MAADRTAHKSSRKRLETKGLVVPASQRPILQGYLYKQEVDHSESAPKLVSNRWVRVFCVLFQNALIYYRIKPMSPKAKPMDLVTLNADFLVRKVKHGAKSANPDKYKFNDTEKEDIVTKMKEMFLLTDLEHLNHYFCTSSVDVKNKWVENITKVISGHQAKIDSGRKVSKRKEGFKEQIKILRQLADQARNSSSANKDRAANMLVEGLGMTKAERKLLSSLNAEKERDFEDMKLMRDGWKDEAIRLRTMLKDAVSKKQRQKSRKQEYGDSVKKLVNELEVRGYERETQRFETEREKSRVKALMKAIDRLHIDDIISDSMSKPSRKSQQPQSDGEDESSQSEDEIDTKVSELKQKLKTLRHKSLKIKSSRAKSDASIDDPVTSAEETDTDAEIIYQRAEMQTGSLNGGGEIDTTEIESHSDINSDDNEDDNYFDATDVELTDVEYEELERETGNKHLKVSRKKESKQESSVIKESKNVPKAYPETDDEVSSSSTDVRVSKSKSSVSRSMGKAANMKNRVEKETRDASVYKAGNKKSDRERLKKQASKYKYFAHEAYY